MLTFFARRVVLLIPTVLGVAFLVFLALHLTPGDPVSAMLGQEYSEDVAAQLREEYRLDQPVVMQYVSWIARVASGDLGRSYGGFGGQSVASQIGQRFPTTLALTVGALALACAVGIPLGILSARFAGSGLDGVTRLISMLGVSMPVFWIGILLIVVFSINLGWLPAGGSYARYGVTAFVLPSVSLAIPFASMLVRLTRGTILDVLAEDFIRTARGKGVSTNIILYKHALRNAMISIVTVIGLQLGVLIGGSVIAETVFSLPGIGRLLLDAIYQRNIPVVQGVSMVIALSFVFANLLVDLAYANLDPRVRYQ